MFVKVKGFPPGNFAAIMLFGIVFHKKDLTYRQIRHEKIHIDQLKEFIFFGLAISLILSFAFQMFWTFLVFPLFLYYIWYGVEWLVRLLLYRDSNVAYKSISLEQDAYIGSTDVCPQRTSLGWVKYLFRKYKAV